MKESLHETYPRRPVPVRVLRRVKGHARPRMPLDGPPYLSEADIQLIESWIVQGARDASGTPAGIPTGARVRLHGVLGADGKLDDLDLGSLAATRKDKLPRPGEYARLEGWLDDQGEVWWSDCAAVNVKVSGPARFGQPR